MLSIAQDLLEFYPREDRPYLNRIVVSAGVFIATNAHVAILGSCDLVDGHYNKDLKPLPEIEDYPVDKIFEYFSKIDRMQLGVAPTPMPDNHIKIGDVLVQLGYWSLFKAGYSDLKHGPCNGIRAAVSGHCNGSLFIIAGVDK